MDKDKEVALFVQLGRIEEKQDVLLELKPDVKANTRFRWFTTAFILILVSMLTFAYQNLRFYKEIKKNGYTITRVIK